MITISGNASGGTFTTSSTNGYYFEVDYMPTDGGPAIAPFTNYTPPPGTPTPCTLGGGPFTWSSTPPVNAFLLLAGYPAFNANQYTIGTLPVNYVTGFYLTGTAMQSCSVPSLGFAFSQTVQQAPASNPPASKATQHNGGSETKAPK